MPIRHGDIVKVTRDDLLKVVNYDPETGIITRISGRFSGKIVNHTNSKGYIRANFLGRLMLAHVVAWIITYGKYPDGEIDHANGIRNDNRIINLRDVTHQQNMWNSKPIAKLKGAHLNANNGKYYAHIRHDGVLRTIGVFENEKDAHIAYVLEALELRGEYARFN